MNQSEATQSGVGPPLTGPPQQTPAEPAASRPVASDPQDRRPPVPDHELISHIGRGSYGEVWLAKNAAVAEPFDVANCTVTVRLVEPCRTIDTRTELSFSDAAKAGELNPI